MGGAAVILLACVGTALAAGGTTTTGAGATSTPLAEPPSAAEAHAWEAEFLRTEGGAESLVPAPATKAPGPRLFPHNKVLSLYGAAGGFGIIGRKSLNGAAKKLNRQIKPYRERSHERVIKAFDLVATLVTQCSGPHDKCRTRVGKSTIRRYLDKIRKLNGRLILDIQPGRADVLDEIAHWRSFIQEPDVDVAIDAEWNIGAGEEPGEDLGSIRARKVNKAAKKVRTIIRNHDLPPKLLIVHQFRKDAIKGRSNLKRLGDVDVTLNFDGIGRPGAKKAGYRQLSSDTLFNGFSLFYELDENLMRPREVLGLHPEPDYVMYQ